MNVMYRTVLFLLLILPGIGRSQFVVARSQPFSFTDKEKGLQIVYSPQGPKLDSIAAHLLANDIKMVTGNQPAVITDLANARGNIIVIGNILSPLIQQLPLPKSVHDDELKESRESYLVNVIDTPVNKVSKALVIAGTDARGTAYGVFSISKRIGVSPWYWWADAPVKQQKELTLILDDEYRINTFQVTYRGIFINDEDWGLRPWAAKTLEPETGNIGPKTYAKVFELLLRLNANLIWPAMHPGTQPFFSNPENKKLAEDYSIIIGSSHAEPMLRNNVGEWNEKTMGPFNYLTNKERVYQYWEQRVKETTSNEAIYTMGMRGVHDSGMEGVKNAKEAVPLLEQIIKDQRGLLEKYRGKPADAIPQAFTAYKEVLDIYDNGLKIPDDITLVWPDDNYGYIQRLSNDTEQKRSGGAGVYYHASYWGRPHDYLWLSTTHPALMFEEMDKARRIGANTIWVLNVGDIKPQEYIMDLFLTVASNRLVGSGGDIRPHLEAWDRSIFGKEHAAQITNVLWQYYELAFERRPEFMGWSRTEPTTQTTTTEYNHFFYGDEAQRRIDQYESLEQQVKALRSQMEPEQAAAFYQLVYYPVMCASWMNKKFLYRDKAIFYAKQNRLSAKDYAVQSKAMYDSIVKETGYYNNQLSGGKWKNIMSMKPRDLPAYQEPVIPDITIDGAAGWSIAPEGFVTKDSSLIDMTHGIQLPAFDNINRQRYFIDVFLSDKKPVDWSAVTAHNYIRLSTNRGSLASEWGKNQVRMWVEIDWTKAPNTQFTDTIVLTGGGKHMEVVIQGHQLNQPKRDRVFVENNGFVSIHAGSSQSHGGMKNNDLRWTEIPDLGYTGKVLQVIFTWQVNEGKSPSLNPATIKKHNAWLEYNFYTYTTARPVVTVFTLPTHPLDNRFSDRYGVSVDDGPLTIVDFKTEGRSEEWKRNVLSNRAARDIHLPLLKKGMHKLKIYCIDPGVMVDEIRIDLGGLKKAYSTLPETTFRRNNP